MVDRWNDVVADSDEVWMLGDLVMNQLSVNLAAHVSRLKGRKILVPGNHDACWQGHRKGPRQVARYLEVGGVARIVDHPSPVVIAGQQVRISHFPYRIDTHHDPRYIEHRPVDDDGWLLHGHIHEKWRQNGRQINVGVDAWSFTPSQRRHHQRDDPHRASEHRLPDLRTRRVGNPALAGQGKRPTSTPPPLDDVETSFASRVCTAALNV